MKTKYENQQTVCEWVEATFGPVASNARIVSRANEEMAELVKDVSIDDRHANLVEEAADIVIVLYRLAERMGADLLEEVDRKMAKNRARRFVSDGSGCGYPVKEERPERKCWSCDGYGTHHGHGPDRGNPTCTTCNGSGIAPAGGKEP